MKYDIVALGELLIDFTPMEERCFQANPGGAPANVLAAGAKLGFSAAFLGMVGEDDFGHMLEQDLKDAGISTHALRFTPAASTTLAFVQLDAHGDRSFTFVRKPGADMLYKAEDVDYDTIENARVFHFGSVSMTNEPSRATTLQAAAHARQKGCIVSYDPNLRPLLWPSLEEARQIMPKGFALADIVKISEEEVEFLFGTTNLEAGADLLHGIGVSLVFITLGPKGCYYSSKKHKGHLHTYDLPVVDTTGAGDAFMGGILAGVLESGKHPKELLEDDVMAKLANFANAVGALATTKKGGILAMPTREKVEHCMQTAPKLVLPLG